MQSYSSILTRLNSTSWWGLLQIPVSFVNSKQYFRATAATNNLKCVSSQGQWQITSVHAAKIWIQMTWLHMEIWSHYSFCSSRSWAKSMGMKIGKRMIKWTAWRHRDGRFVIILSHLSDQLFSACWCLRPHRVLWYLLWRGRLCHSKPRCHFLLAALHA